LNSLLTPYFLLVLTGPEFGQQSIIYASIPFLFVIFTYGLETTFFRYAQKHGNPQELYNTLLVSIFSSTVLVGGVLLALADPIAHLLLVEQHPELIHLTIFIVATDALSALPFAKLRLDGRPRKYALIKVSGIVCNMALLYFFLSVCPALKAKGGISPLLLLYSPAFGLGYVFVANLVQNILQLILLLPEFAGFRPQFNLTLWKAMIIYSLPITVYNFAGMVNETFDRVMLGWWVRAPSRDAAEVQVAIYSANYKLSMFISLFIQAFRMGAEPFFFKQSKGENPQRVYARVMKFFVLTITLMFLFVALYLDIWKYFITKHYMWVGLKVVPIFLFSNMFLGIYYNLSIWYKLSDKTSAGAYITLIGAGITLAINYFFIPSFGYMACAWATCICYGTMMVLSYIWGQRVYPIPYAWKKLVAYMVIVLVLYLIHRGVVHLYPSLWLNLGTSTVLFLAYLAFIGRVEKKEFSRLPYINRIPLLRNLVSP